MDTITHGIVGALAGKALFAGPDVPARGDGADREDARSSPIAKTAIVACTIGSIFPDIDIFAGALARNPLAIMEWHRNITHSLMLLPVWALLLAWASLPLTRWLRWQQPTFPALAGIYALGLATHVFLDLVTNFGTMVWSPLQYSRPAWDWLYIVDLSLTGFALVPQLVAWCYRVPEKFPLRSGWVWIGLAAAAFGARTLSLSSGYPFPLWVVGATIAIFTVVLFAPTMGGLGFRWQRSNWCRVGLTLVCIYLGCAAAMHAKALTNVDRFVAENHLRAENRAALPLPPTLTHWAGLVSTPEGIWRTTFHMPGGAIERTQLYDTNASDPYVEQAKKLRGVQIYLWFARFPIWRIQESKTQTVVEISDLRFFREDDPEAIAISQRSKGSARIRTNAGGFTFQVVFDAAGNIVSSGFRNARP